MVLKRRVQAAFNAYKVAEETSLNSQMLPADPIRLGLALNMSTFFKDILEDPDCAIDFAQEAYDKAVKEMENVEKPKVAEVKTLLQLLRDNIMLWKSEKLGIIKAKKN